MKKLTFFLACLTGFVVGARAQTVAIKIDAGELKNATGTSSEPVSGLLELIASPSGSFSAPTSTAVVTGDNIIVASFAMNMNAGTAETINNLNVVPLSTGAIPPTETGYTLGSNYTLTPNEALTLRFFPSATYSSSGQPSAPAVGTTYGQVRSGSIEFGATGGDASETAWVVPGAGSAVDFDYVTISNGGTYSNISAQATNVVLLGAVPEPSTYAFFTCAFLGVVGLRSLNHRRQLS